MPVFFAMKDSLIPIRSQSAASLATARTWMGDRFREKRISNPYICR